MVSREEAKSAWARNFAARLSTLADRAGNTDDYVRGVANYLGETESSIRNSDSGQAIIDTFESNSDFTESELENRIVEGTDSNSLEDALSELADKWDSNYAEAFTG